MEWLAEIDLWWLASLVTALLITGVIAGVMAGLLGIGGGIVIVPVLYHLFTLLGVDEAVRMHMAVGTSLATIIPTSMSSARSHWRRGSLDTGLLKQLGAGVVGGVVVGAAISGWVSGPALSVIFAVVAMAVALNMGLHQEPLVLRDQLPGAPGCLAIGGVIGSLSTMMGIGGGTLSVPLLSAFGAEIRRAVGTAAAIGLIISVPGTLGFIITGLGMPGRPPASLGYANLAGFAVIVPMTILMAPVGARLAHAINPRRLKQFFALFLLATSLRILGDVLVW